MALSPERWQAVRALFDQLADLPSTARAQALTQAGLNAEEAAELQSLLAHADALQTGVGQGFMAQAAALADTAGGAASGDTGQDAPVVQPGDRLGNWAVLGPLGQGGMGEVFEARRADGQFEGRAAIKLLKRGMDSAAVLQRFAQERQALARLQHPNIATLLDAGISPRGLPFFVMAYVAGQPIDQAVRGLALEARLRLFLQLTDAVAYAHRQLLVHRDLKPGNVLVTPEGQVQLLDFGIAKALEPASGPDGGPNHQDTTVGMARPFTPHYASPEQVRGDAVGTATDIYSLGVLLYQLLTGTRPTGRHATTAAEAARSVLEETPTRPSRLSPSEAVDPDWLQHRKRLQGDLDNILLKALEKDAERRYATVDAFSADLQAFLQGRPVSARAASAAYVFGKFVRRNRPAVAGATAAVLALAVGLGVAAWQGAQARAARDEAQARLADIRGITRDLVFRFGDSIGYLPGGMQIKEALLQDALRSLDRLAQGRDRDPALLADVANTYARLAELQGNDQSLSLGKPDAGRVNAQKAVALGDPLLATRRQDWRLATWMARAHLVLAQVHRSEGQPAKGIPDLQAAARVLAEADFSQADELGRTTALGQRGAVLITLAQLLEQAALQQGGPLAPAMTPALAAYADAEAVYRGLAGERPMLERLDATGRPEEPKAYAQVLNQLATVLDSRAQLNNRRDRLPEALADTQAAVALQQQAVAYDPLTQIWRDGLATLANTSAVVWLKQGDGAKALAAAQLSRETAQALVRSEGPTSKWALQFHRLGPQYARALAATGQHAQALPVFQDTIAFFQPLAAKASANAAGERTRRTLAGLQTQQAASLLALGRAAQAQAPALAAEAALKPLADAATPAREAVVMHAEALVVLASLNPAQAQALKAQALQRLQAADALLPLVGTAAALKQRLQAP